MHTNFGKKDNDVLAVVFLLVIVFASRLPFIFSGYGLDADGWSLVNSGYFLSSTGVYHPSRFPGYPVPEFISGLIWLLKLPYSFPSIFNLLTVFIGVASVYYFFLIAVKFLIRDKYLIYLSVLAFAFTPVFYINSTVIMDYVWALFFILGSVYYLISKRLILSAVFLAIAAGCRITSVLIIIPAIYYLIPQYKTEQKKILFSFLIFIVSALIIFSPLLFKYGISFFKFDRPPAEYSIIKIAGRFSLRTWGLTGSIAILIAVIQILISKQSKDLFTKNKFAVYSLISIIIYLILFFMLPLDAGYLLPLIPFVILLIYKTLSKKLLFMVSILIIVSPFILDVEVNNISAEGPIFMNCHKRIEEENYINEVIRKTEKLDKPSLIICEALLQKIELTLKLKKESVPQNINFVYTLPEDSLRYIIKTKNPEVFYLINVREATLNIYGYDLKLLNAKEIPISQ